MLQVQLLVAGPGTQVLLALYKLAAAAGMVAAAAAGMHWLHTGMVLAAAAARAAAVAVQQTGTLRLLLWVQTGWQRRQRGLQQRTLYHRWRWGLQVHCTGSAV
jgi:hypothetical protein